jgi:flagellar biogenesis protein FliO
MFFYFAIFLFICALIFGLFYGAVRLIRSMEEQRARIAEEEN